MKRLITLIMAGCFILGSLGTAAAIDVKVNGQWQFAYGYYNNHSQYSNERTGQHVDPLMFRFRLRTQVQFIASETLSSMLNFELGDHYFGRSGGGSGGGLDADDRDSIKLKHAYLDWIIPGTQIKTRQGIQGLRLPWVVAGNPVMDADVAGITVSTQFTPEVGLTVFWARPFDANFGENEATTRNVYDEMDMFGFMLPIKTQAIRITPWAMGALIGRDSGYYNNGAASAFHTNVGDGTGRGRAFLDDKADSQGYGWWAGFSFELPAIDPFFIKLDAMVGGLDTGSSDSDTWGYFVSTDIGYKFSWGTPSFIGWYSSGDKDADKRRTMPIVSDDNGFFMTSYGMQGKYSRGLDGAISINGLGMWGIGLQIKDVSFVQNLTHLARVMYMRGTNEGDSWVTGKTLGQKSIFYNNSQLAGTHDGFLMSSDSAWEFNLRSVYKVNQNLEVGLDLNYITMNMGPQQKNTTDSFGALLGIQYSF